MPELYKRVGLGAVLGAVTGAGLGTVVGYAPATCATVWALGILLFTKGAYAPLQHLPRAMLLGAGTRQTVLLLGWPLLLNAVACGYAANRILEFADHE